MVKNAPAVLETWVRSLGSEDPLEESVATYSTILAWRIPIDRGAWWATVRGVAKSQTRLSHWSDLILSSMPNSERESESCSVLSDSLQLFATVSVQFSSVAQLLSHVRLFAIPWIAAHQASLSITNSRSSLRLTSIESVMLSSHLILCRPLLLLPQSLPASESFPMSQHFTSGGQSTGVSASASFPPKKSQGWSPLEWTGWISLQSKGRSRVFSNTTVQKHQLFSTQPSLQSNSHIHTWPQEKP